MYSGLGTAVWAGRHLQEDPSDRPLPGACAGDSLPEERDGRTPPSQLGHPRTVASAWRSPPRSLREASCHLVSGMQRGPETLPVRSDVAPTRTPLSLEIKPQPSERLCARNALLRVGSPDS